MGSPEGEEAAMFSRWVSPAWKSVTLLVHAFDGAASDQAANGNEEQTLTWRGVPVPAQMETPLAVGTAQTTGHGTTVSLEKIMLRRMTAPSAKGDEAVTLVFRLTPPPGSAALTAALAPHVELSDSAGKTLNEDPAIFPAKRDITNGATGFMSYRIPVAIDDLKAGAINVAATIQEHSAAFADPNASRDLAIEIPLANLPGAGADRPDSSVAHAAAGPLSATLESLTATSPNRWSASVWVKSPAVGPSFQINRCDIMTDTGTSLGANLAGWSGQNTPLWKADGSAVRPGEAFHKFDLAIASPAPDYARSVTISLGATCETAITRRFSFKNIPCPPLGPAVDVDLEATADSQQNDGSETAPDSTRLAITKLQVLPSDGRPHGSTAKYRLDIYFRVDHDPVDPAGRFCRPTSITDDQGRVLSFNPLTFSFGPRRSYEFVSSVAPEPDAKTLNFEFQVHDTVEDALPVTLMFKNLPIPVPAAQPAAGK